MHLKVGVIIRKYRKNRKGREKSKKNDYCIICREDV